MDRGCSTSLTAAVLLAYSVVFTASPAAACSGHHSSRSHGDSHAGSHSEHESGHIDSRQATWLHGGLLTNARGRNFEVLFKPTEVRVYVYDDAEIPVLDPQNTRVQVVVGKKPETIRMALGYVPPDASAGRTHGYFAAPLASADPSLANRKASFRIEDESGKPADFKVPVLVRAQAEYRCSMHPELLAEDPMACPKCGMVMGMVTIPADNHVDDVDHNQGG